MIQGEVRPELLGREVLKLVEQPQRSHELVAAFTRIHESLRRDANRQIADMMLEMVGRHGQLV
jgi:lipid A disaccharide synthetase